MGKFARIVCTLLGVAAVAGLVGRVDGAEAAGGWLPARMKGEKWASFEEVLPEALMAAVRREVHVVHNYEMSQPAYRHGKRSTYWLGKMKAKAPRFAIEAAIEYLHQVAFAGESGPIRGAEWWVQSRRLDEDIGFHYDKDEGLASEYGRMLTPAVSTVTYITDEGAPTMVLDQLTVHGAADEPKVPRRGMLSYPKRNKHLLFAGNLNHGVPAAMTPKGQLNETGAFRTTLLVNWWPKKPMGPNCIKFSAELLAAMEVNLYTGDALAQVMQDIGWDSQKQRATHVRAKEGSVEVLKGTRGDGWLRHVITVGLGAQLRFSAPEFLPDRAAHRNYELRWSEEQVHGGVGVFDPDNRALMHNVFGTEKPVVFVFGTSQQWESGLRDMVWPATKRHARAVSVYWVEPRRGQAALERVGLSAQEEFPVLALMDNGKHRVEVMGARGSRVEEEAVEEFFGRAAGSAGSVQGRGEGRVKEEL